MIRPRNRVLSLALLVGGCVARGEREPEPRVALEPCQIGAPGSPVRVAAECGTLSVPEDRSRPESRRIDLRLAVVRAVSRNPAPDPLVFLTGGPGQAATESYVSVRAAFRRIQRDRDILLVDQRGTGGSNPLRCPATEASDPALLDEALVRPWVETCLQGLDGDPRFYLTSNAMDDLDEVREALGYDRVNLYGVSYGTRAALTYLRRYPDRVRAVILDGVAPPTEALGLDVAKDAERAMNLMIARCAAEPACREAFPDLETELDRLMERLSTPVEISLRHPRTGAPETLHLSSGMAAYAIRLLSYGQETVSLVPLLLRSAADSDYEPLAAQFLLVTTQVGETIADGMGISVICSEDFPFLDEEVAEEKNRDTYLGSMQTDSLSLVCPLWPRGEIPQDFKAPLRSRTPILLLSGEADPVTPPENAEQTLSELGSVETALHLVAPGQGHVVIHRGCIPRLAEEFLDAGSVSGLDASCVAAIAPMAFFTTFAGPTP